MNEVVIVSGCRTAVGAFGGVLKDTPVVELGALVLHETLKRVHLRPITSEAIKSYGVSKLNEKGPVMLGSASMAWDEDAHPVGVDEVIMGNVLQAGQGQNTARQAMVRAGIPIETPACTINKVCGSGLKAIAMGAASIASGQCDVVLAGGHENMSQTPMALPKGRWGHRMEISGSGEIRDLMVYDGLFEIFYGYHMGMTAENIARLFNISRREQDELSLLSHTRARTAISQGLFASEIVPVETRKKKEIIAVDTDERPMDTSMEKLARLKPVFLETGTVTAGNASGINDGAAAVLLMSAQKAREYGLKPFAKIAGFASAGVDPAYMGMGPVPAIRKVCDRTNIALADIEMIELNEAFAAQAIGCMRELNIDTSKPNELGSGISLGHPIGCTGARQMVTAIHLMRRKGHETGLVSMCIGGGMGMAMLITQ